MVEKFGDRLELLKEFQLLDLKVCLFLKSGLEFSGRIFRVEKDKIRIITKERKLMKETFYLDTWPQQIIAIQFEANMPYYELPFKPYQVKQSDYCDFPILKGRKGYELYGDIHDLLGYYLEGKRQVNTVYVDIFLSNGKRFTGSLEIVNADRVLLSLDTNTYLDFHPSVVSAVLCKIGEQGWPYDPTAC